MKKKKMFLGIGLLAVGLIISVLVVIAIIVTRIQENTNVSIFYKEPVLNTLAEVRVNVMQSDNEKMVDEILKQVKAVPKNSELVSALNTDVGFLGFRLDDDKRLVVVNISPSYYNLSDTDALFVRLSIVWSLTSLEFVDNVAFEVNGEPLLNANGEVCEISNRSNMVINQQIQPYNTEKRTIKLYFLEKSGLGLISETRDIEVKQNIALEFQIVEQLIEGPKKSESMAIIPKGTKIRNIETKEGTCYVDLSSEFIPSNEGVANETYIIYSIVNSLTEINYINKVQFLIEGKKAESLKELPDFSKTYERDEKCIVTGESKKTYNAENNTNEKFKK